MNASLSRNVRPQSTGFPNYSNLIIYNSYILFPLFSLINIFRNFIDILTITFAVLACFHSHWNSRRIQIFAPLFAFSSLSILYNLRSFFEVQNLDVVDILNDNKMVVYMLSVGLIFIRSGAPSVHAITTGGKFITFFLFMQFALSGFSSRPIGSGETNYDAFLISLSILYRAFKNGRFERADVYLFFGLLITFSRTTLIAVCFSFAFMYLIGRVRINIFIIIMAVAVLLGATLFSFYMRGLDIDTDSFDRLYMYNSFVGLLARSDVVQLLFGYPLGDVVPAITPPELKWLWESQVVDRSKFGVYPFLFHAFWLRLILNYGAVGVIAFLTAHAVFAARAVSTLPLMLFYFLCGTTNGVYYLSNSGPPALLILASFVLVSGDVGEQNAVRRR